MSEKEQQMIKELALGVFPFSIVYFLLVGFGLDNWFIAFFWYWWSYLSYLTIRLAMFKNSGGKAVGSFYAEMVFAPVVFGFSIWITFFMMIFDGIAWIKRWRDE